MAGSFSYSSESFAPRLFSTKRIRNSKSFKEFPYDDDSFIQLFPGCHQPITAIMILERHQIQELDTLLSQLLSLKDSDFTKFLNNSEALKPFCTGLQAFWSTSNVMPIDELTLSLHEKFFKFLLRLCPSFNCKIPKPEHSDNKLGNHALRAVICPKKVIDCLFEIDPLGLLCYLYETWHPSDLLDTIRDELVPNNILKHSSFSSSDRIASNSQINGFIRWLTKNSTFNGALKNNERYISCNHINLLMLMFWFY